MAWTGPANNKPGDYLCSLSSLLVASVDLLWVSLVFLSAVFTFFTSSFIRISGLHIPCSCFAARHRLKHRRNRETTTAAAARRSKSSVTNSNNNNSSNQSGGSRQQSSAGKKMEEASSNASSGLDNNRDLEENGENERLLKALRDEREAQAALYHELEKERNAAATAANEAMAMITRLQEEKALVQMEARQFQRMVEEKAVYDQEAMEILKEVLARREEEKNQLEDEMRKCKTKLLGRDQATVPERRRNETMQPGCSSRDTEDSGLFPITTAGVPTKRSTARAAAAAARETEKPQEADSVIRLKRKWDSQGTTEEQVFPDQNKGKEPPLPPASFSEREIEEKRLSVLEYVWKFEEQLHHHQQGGRQPPSAPTGGRPRSAGDEQTSEDERRRTMCHHSNSSPQKAATVVSGKLEKEENLGKDDETCRSMGLGFLAEAVHGEEDDLFMQDIYEVHNASHHEPPSVVMQDTDEDCWGWDSRIRHKSDLDQLGKLDLLILHEEETRDSTREDTHCHHWSQNVASLHEVGSSGVHRSHCEEILCDNEIRESEPMIRRDSARAPSVDKEIMHLTLRLKTLEADRHLMKQTIESLRRENGEMKLLQEIAQQLRELRDMEQKDSQKQSNPFPLTSSCQGMMSFTHLFNSAQIQLSKLAHVCLGNVVTRDCKAHVGLGHLLHFSPKPSTCITQVRRADIPATLSAIKGGGFGTSANIEVAKWLLQTG
ncbi:unnamed protein product [Sphagnum tenellum]